MRLDPRLVVKDGSDLPRLLRPEEVASLLRTTRKAIYGLVERGAIPGVRRVGRRVLFVRDEVLRWLELDGGAPLPAPKESRGTVLTFRHEVRASSPKEEKR